MTSLLYRTDCRGSDGCYSLNQDFEDLSTWAVKSNVKFNAAKSAELYIGNKHHPVFLHINGEMVDCARSKRHLDVVIASTLSWNTHVESMLQKVSGPLALIKSLSYRRRLSSGTIRTFYLAYVRLCL